MREEPEYIMENRREAALWYCLFNKRRHEHVGSTKSQQPTAHSLENTDKNVPMIAESPRRQESGDHTEISNQRGRSSMSPYEKRMVVLTLIIASITGVYAYFAAKQWCALVDANRVAMLQSAAEVELSNFDVTNAPATGGPNTVNLAFRLTFANAGRTVAVENIRPQLESYRREIGELRKKPASPINDGLIRTDERWIQDFADILKGNLVVVGTSRVQAGRSATYVYLPRTFESTEYSVLVYGDFSFYDQVFEKSINTPFCLRRDSDGSTGPCSTLQPRVEGQESQ